MALLPCTGAPPRFTSYSSTSSPVQSRVDFSSKSQFCSYPFRSSFHSISLQSISAFTEKPQVRYREAFVVRAAYTRRSKQEAAKWPNRKSWKQRTEMYMRPFMLNVFFSKRFVHAKVVHRGTSKVICAATTNAKDLRNTLPSLTDNNACRVIGQLIAERSMDADIFAVGFELKKNERIDGKLGIVLDTIKEKGMIFVE